MIMNVYHSSLSCRANFKYQPKDIELTSRVIEITQSFTDHCIRLCDATVKDQAANF